MSDGTLWTIEAFCRAQSPVVDLTLLPESTRAFLQSLPSHVTAVHPFCQLFDNDSYPIPGIPNQGPLLHADHLETWWDVVVTAVAMVGPELAALSELWLRLFASALAPLCVLRLLQEEMSQVSSNNKHNKNSNKEASSLLFWCSLLGVASSVVLFTDTLYVMEYGPVYGASFLMASTVLAWRRTRQNENTKYKSVLRFPLLPGFVVLAVFLSAHPCTGPAATNCIMSIFQFSAGDPHQQVTNVPEGVYYDKSNPFMERIVEQEWSPLDREYTCTPWMPTGDSRTGLPFLLNHLPAPPKIRMWLQVSSDEEVLALDMFFPKSGHDPTKPLYMVLHGLNGGSEEDFGEDFVWERTHKEGSTVVVMVARGLMDLPVRGWNVFHGARWTDVDETAKALRQAVAPNQMLAGVGYSMGAIIMGNYVTRSGKDCALDAAVAISGGLDTRFMIDYHRAQRLWQPLLTKELRGTFVVGKWGERVRARLTKDELKSMMRATHISEIDLTAVVAYNGYKNLTHYYSEMSALGDIPMDEYYKDQLSPDRRIHNVSIPFCVLHALDDPLVTWKTVAANHGLMHPINLTKTGSGNLVILLTKQGGHVGWPMGWLPFVAKWSYMNNVAKSFVHAVQAAKQLA